MILTRCGWLRYDEVRPGDETIGYNPHTGMSQWTRVTAIYCYKDAEVWRIGNAHWTADATPDHRWWSDTRVVRSPEALTACPECGWVGRTDSAAIRKGIAVTPRSISTHRGRVHGVKDEPTLTYAGEFVRTADMKADHRLRLAAPAATDGIANLSLIDVRVLAWLQGDGHVSRVLAKPQACPECGWLPGTERHNRYPAQPANSVAVHRAKKHGLGKDRTAGIPAGWDGSIFQSKATQVATLGELLIDVPHTISVRHRGGNTIPAYQFRLRRSYVTDLMERSRLAETGPEAFVLALAPEQRAAWLDSMIDAEGHRQLVTSMGQRRGASGEFVRIAQIDGPLQDAIKLAVFLEGYRPTFSQLSAERRGFKPSGHVGMARPHIAPGMFDEPAVLPRQAVWCVTTELGTLTTRGKHRLPFLTGNSSR